MADEAFKEKLKSLSFGRVPGGSRPFNPGKFTGMRQPSWEAGIKRDERGVPYVHGDSAQPITVKEFANNRGHYEAQIADHRAASTSQE